MIVLAFALAVAAATPQIPPAIYTDPPHDAVHPAQMIVLHIPSGGVAINGVAYLAAGAGAHPTLVLLHGLPGNEKNLDLAQAVRRAGWNAITFNYRGSWGSPGSFRFAQTLQDADAVLAYVRENAGKLGVDTARIVIAGHSMGGWVTAMTAAHDRNLRGAILLSGANMGGRSGDRAKLVEGMRENMESLADVTAESMADELTANAKSFDWTNAVPGLAHLPLLVLTANDGLAPQDDALADAVKKAGNSRVTVVHAATDHSWSDRRIELESIVIRWLEQLR
jgi:pimeloyl-ACP methyl ester carboxylesterase